MAISIVQTLTKAASTGVTTLQSAAFGSSVTAGNTIVVFIANSGLSPGISSVTDTAGNTYTADKTGVAQSNAIGAIYRSSNVTGGANFKITVNLSSSGKVTFGAVEVSGLATSPVDQSNRNSGASTTTPTTGAVTTTVASELICIVTGEAGSSITFTEPGGFASQVQESGATNVNMDGATQIVSALQVGLNPQWTTTGSAFSAAIVTYKASAVIGGPHIPAPDHPDSFPPANPAYGPWGITRSFFPTSMLPPVVPAGAGTPAQLFSPFVPPMFLAPFQVFPPSLLIPSIAPPAVVPPPTRIPGPIPLSGVLPIAGPWNLSTPAVALPVPFPPVGPPPPPPPPGPKVPSHIVPMIPRMPQWDEKRARQHMDIVASVLNSLFAQGLVTQTGPATYNIPTAIPSTVPRILGQGDLLAQTGPVTVCSFADTGNGGVYRVSGYIHITAIATDVLDYQVLWTDETGVVQRVSWVPLGSGSPNPSLNLALVYALPDFTVKVKAATTITLQVALNTGGGTVTYDVGGTIEKVR